MRSGKSLHPALCRNSAIASTDGFNGKILPRFVSLAARTSPLPYRLAKGG